MRANVSINNDFGTSPRTRYFTIRCLSLIGQHAVNRVRLWRCRLRSHLPGQRQKASRQHLGCWYSKDSTPPGERQLIEPLISKARGAPHFELALITGCCGTFKTEPRGQLFVS